MKATVIKAVTIKTPQQYLNDRYANIGKYCTCILNKTNKSGAITLIDWNDIVSSEESITQDISITTFVKLLTTDKNKFCSQAYKCYSSEERLYSFFACNIFFDSFEEAQKEYLKLSLLWSIT